MSKLEYLARPLVAFDPHNKDHRRYYAEYLEYKGWGTCPVRFICTERSDVLSRKADSLYKEAGKLRIESKALLKPRRS